MTDINASKSLFQLPDGVVYLDGNSLGPLPRAAAERIRKTVEDEWGAMLIGGWNDAGWMAQPASLGDRIGRLIGSEPGQVMLGDTLSIKVFQALAAALDKTDRRTILTDSGNFPSDVYMAEGLVRALGQGHRIKTVDPDEVEGAIDEEVAVLMLTHVDYRTGRMHDMEALTARAREAGALTVWDLAHSAGAVMVDLAACGADFAVGCTYKFLNGGPGAPAFIYVAPRHASSIEPILAGWLGHDAPFAFERDYRPANGVGRLRVGTPPVIQMAALDASLEIWDGVDMRDVRRASILLGERLIDGLERACPGHLELVSPRDPEQRGSQVSFRHPAGYAAIQACIERGVVGDFRAPNIMRFGLTPLYLTPEDIDRAVEVIATVMNERLWDDPRHEQRKTVT